MNRPFDATYWRKRGFAEVPPTRTQLLERSIDHLSQDGIERFRAAAVCEELFVNRSLVNHYFGSQDGLIAEATVRSYERYVERLRQAALQGSTPLARLEAWILEQIAWAKENRGLFMLIQLPHPEAAALQAKLFDGAMEQAFKLNLLVLGQLVEGAKRDELLPLEWDDLDAALADRASNINFAFAASSVGLSALGAAVWAAGADVPSRGLNEYFLNEAMLLQHVRWAVQTAINAT